MLVLTPVVMNEVVVGVVRDVKNVLYVMMFVV